MGVDVNKRVPAVSLAQRREVTRNLVTSAVASVEGLFALGIGPAMKVFMMSCLILASRVTV